MAMFWKLVSRFEELGKRSIVSATGNVHLWAIHIGCFSVASTSAHTQVTIFKVFVGPSLLHGLHRAAGSGRGGEVSHTA